MQGHRSWLGGCWAAEAVNRHPVVSAGVGVHSERALFEPCYKALIKHTCWAIPQSQSQSPSQSLSHLAFPPLRPLPLLVCGGDNDTPPNHPTSQPPKTPSPSRPLVQWLNPTSTTIQKGSKLPLIMMGWHYTYALVVTT